MDFPPFLRCTRTGNGNWRCTSMAAPGRSYCQRHYEEQKRRNQRKRDRKLAAASSLLLIVGSGRAGPKRRRMEEDDEDEEDWCDDKGKGKRKAVGEMSSEVSEGEWSDEENTEEETSETEHIMKRTMPERKGRGIYHYSMEKGVFDSDKGDDDGEFSVHGRGLGASRKQRSGSGRGKPSSNADAGRKKRNLDKEEENSSKRKQGLIKDAPKHSSGHEKGLLDSHGNCSKMARDAGQEAKDIMKWKWDTSKVSGNSVEGNISKPCVGRRSVSSRKRRDFGSRASSLTSTVS